MTTPINRLLLAFVNIYSRQTHVGESDKFRRSDEIKSHAPQVRIFPSIVFLINEPRPRLGE